MSTTMTPRRLAILVASSKGGSGKTTFARGLIDYYRAQHDLNVAAYDADGGTESLLQYYGERDMHGKHLPEDQRDPIKGVKNFSVRADRQRDQLINVFDETKAPRTIIDLPGGGEEEIEKVLGDADRFFAAYEELGVKPIVAIVINSTKSSAASVPIIMEMFGSRPHFIVVKNPSNGSRFRHFEGVQDKEGNMLFGRARQRVIDSGGDVITIPRLDVDTYEDVDWLSLRWDEATEDTRLSFTDRLRVREWRKGLAASLQGTILEARTELSVVGAA